MSIFLTPTELADRWNMKTTSLANYRSLGTGPDYLKIAPRKILYALEDIEAYEAERRSSSEEKEGDAAHL